MPRNDDPKDPPFESGAPRRPPEAEEDEQERRLRQRLEAFLPEIMRRTLQAGLGAVLTTEEGIRRLTKDYALPKDVAAYLMNTASSTKDDFIRIVARETREFLQSVNLGTELAKMLTLLSVEVKTEFRFIPNDESLLKVTPNVRPRVRVRRTTQQGGPPEPEAGASPDGTDDGDL